MSESGNDVSDAVAQSSKNTDGSSGVGLEVARVEWMLYRRRYTEHKVRGSVRNFKMTTKEWETIFGGSVATTVASS